MGGTLAKCGVVSTHATLDSPSHQKSLDHFFGPALRANHRMFELQELAQAQSRRSHG